MRKNIARAVVLASPAILLNNRALAFWRAFLTRVYMPCVGKASGAITYPIFGMLLLMLAGALIARFSAKRFLAALLTVAWLLVAIWFPLYGVRRYETCSDYTREELASLCEKLSDMTAAYVCEPSGADMDFSFSEGRVKAARYPEMLNGAGIAGIYIPFTCEAIVSSLEPAFSVPFIARHEFAHARGLADEGQATIDAYAQCASSEDARVRYSGYAEALKYALNALSEMSESAARDIFNALPARAQADLRIIGVFSENADAPFYAAGEYSDIVGGLIAADRRGIDISAMTPSDPMA